MIAASLILIACFLMTAPAVYAIASTTPPGCHWDQVGAAEFLRGPDGTAWGHIVRAEPSVWRTCGHSYSTAAEARAALCRRVRGWQ